MKPQDFHWKPEQLLRAYGKQPSLEKVFGGGKFHPECADEALTCVSDLQQTRVLLNRIENYASLHDYQGGLYKAHAPLLEPVAAWLENPELKAYKATSSLSEREAAMELEVEDAYRYSQSLEERANALREAVPVNGETINLAQLKVMLPRLAMEEERREVWAQMMDAVTSTHYRHTIFGLIREAVQLAEDYHLEEAAPLRHRTGLTLDDEADWKQAIGLLDRSGYTALNHRYFKFAAKARGERVGHPAHMDTHYFHPASFSIDEAKEILLRLFEGIGGNEARAFVEAYFKPENGLLNLNPTGVAGTWRNFDGKSYITQPFIGQAYDIQELAHELAHAWLYEQARRKSSFALISDHANEFMAMLMEMRCAQEMLHYFKKKDPINYQEVLAAHVYSMLDTLVHRSAEGVFEDALHMHALKSVADMERHWGAIARRAFGPYFDVNEYRHRPLHTHMYFYPRYCNAYSQVGALVAGTFAKMEEEEKKNPNAFRERLESFIDAVASPNSKTLKELLVSSFDLSFPQSWSAGQQWIGGMLNELERSVGHHKHIGPFLKTVTERLRHESTRVVGL